MIIYFLVFLTQIFLCFSKSIYFEGVFYEFKETEATYKDAEDKCVNQGRILALVKNRRIQNALQNVSASEETNGTGSSEYYVGLKYIAGENFVWENGMFDVPNLIWNDTMPEVKNEACVFMTRTGKMSMGSCLEKRKYICSNNTRHYMPDIENQGLCKSGFFRFLNYCYKLNLKCSDRTFTWDEANKYCKSLNSSLLVIDSFLEQDFISSLMTISPQPSWTGLIHKNISRYISLWIDNSTDTMARYPIRFKFGEPNGYRTNEEHCVMVYNRLSNIGYFNDEMCNKSLNYICKMPAMKNDSNADITTQLPNPLYRRGRCKNNFVEFNETCYYLKHLQKSYEESHKICENRTLEIYNRIHIAFIRSLMSFIDVSDVWISIFDKKGNINGAKWLVNETSKESSFLTPDKCYYMTTQQGIGIAKSCFLKNIATACYYYLDGHEEVTVEFTCPKDWLKVGLKCFKVINTYSTFSEAITYCNKNNRKLATLTNMKEVLAVESIIQSNTWIGMDGNSYLNNSWIDGTNIDYCLFRHTTNLTATILANSNKICFVIKYKKTEWDDKECSNTKNFVCEMPAVKHKCSTDFPIIIDGEHYGNFNVSLSWLEAERFCQRKCDNNTHLASFHSTLQENNVFSQISDSDEHWIGMKIYDFKKMWIDGSLTNYLRPYVILNSDDVHFTCFSSQKVYSSSTSMTTTRWNLVNCEIKRKFVCKISDEAQNIFPINYSNVTTNGYCPRGFSKVKNSCFKIINETATWTNAVKLCNEIKISNGQAKLASFQSKEEFEFVLSKMRNYSSFIWIGLYKDHKTEQYAWVDEKPLTFENFLDYINPDSILAGNKTAMFVSTNPFKNGYWKLVAEITNLPYICRTDPSEPSSQVEISASEKCPPPFNTEYNGYCYYYSNKSLSFANAYEYCNNKGSDLLVLNDTFEEQFIKYFLSDKSRNNKLIWMGFKIDASISMLAEWVTPKHIPIYYTHWKDVIHDESDHLYTDFTPQSKIHGCYTFNLSSYFNIFNEIDHNTINNAMKISSCDITIPFVCKVPLNSKKLEVSKPVTCAISRDNVRYDIHVTKTRNNNVCIRWDIVKMSNTLDYHLHTFLYSSIPFNKDGYISYSLNRCSELNNLKQELGYSCYIFKDGKYFLESCNMRVCGSIAPMSLGKSSSKAVLILLLVFTVLLMAFCFLFLLRKRILSNYRFRSFIAHVLGRYPPDWIGDSNRPHTSPGGGVGFTNPVYSPLDNEVNMIL